MPGDVHDGILKGLYCYRESEKSDAPRVNLLASGPTLRHAIAAADELESDHGVAVDIYSVTSYKELRRDALEITRCNKLHPDDEPKTPYLTQQLSQRQANATVAVSDYITALPDTVSRWVPTPWTSLGTDGFGRSETRENLRDFFQIDQKHIVYAALCSLAAEGITDTDVPLKYREENNINPDAPHPWTR